MLKNNDCFTSNASSTAITAGVLIAGMTMPNSLVYPTKVDRFKTANTAYYSECNLDSQTAFSYAGLNDSLLYSPSLDEESLALDSPNMTYDFIKGVDTSNWL